MAPCRGVIAVGSEPVRTLAPIRFGDAFELDVRSFELRRSGQALKLERIPMEVLILLVEYRGQLVTRDQIAERVWGKETFLDTDNSINAAIRKIRQVLDDDPEQPRFVLTVTGKGYRFVASVRESSPPSEQAPESSAAPESLPGANLLGTKISHYRLLSILGGGGMGVVYKAEDLRLGRAVALKLLPGELASDPIAFERLQREARAASSLDHPNICSIYELGEHKGQPFIVMQLLEGQTLREWIESTTSRDTPAHPKQLLELAVQILDGLEAAHAKGIIHRDIKPANIFITNRGQAKILDFGVAKFVDATEPADKSRSVPSTEGTASSRSSDSQLTRTGASIGTPSYLSPEQIRGEKLDARTDLFSFGLVLYEMATGKQAYSGKTVSEIRNAVLTRPPAPACQLNPNVSPELERIIAKSLEKDRDCRYQRADDLREDLLVLNKRSATASAYPVRMLAWIAGMLLIVGLTILAVNFRAIKAHLAGSVGSAGSVTGKPRASIAILGFKNLSGDHDKAWISTALSEMVAAELAAGQQLRVIPSEDVARMKLDLALPAADSYGQDTLRKIRTHLNSDIVVLGSYLDVGRDTAGKIRIDFELQDTRTGETFAVVSREGTESNLAKLVAQGGADLRQKLGVNDVPAGDARYVLASVPSNPEAARLYSQGLQKLQTYDARAARDMLEKAVALDPKHAMSHSVLAESYYALGYEAKAREEAKTAFDLSGDLSREERLSIEGRYRELSHDLPSAIDIYRTLRNFFPDDINYALRLATAQINATLGNDALQTISLMRKLPAPMNQDIRIDLAEASAAFTLSDFKRSHEAAGRAEAKAAAQGSYLLFATAKVREAWSSAHLGDLDGAFASYTKARELWLQGGNSRGAAAALHGIANIQRDQGNFLGARKSFEEALAEFRRIGAMRDLGSCTHNFGVLLSYQGNLREAKKQLDEALRIQRELRYQLGIASDLDDIGNVLESLGDLAGAERDKEEALQIFRNLNNGFGESTTLLNLGEVLLAGGRLSPAKERFEQAMAVAQKIGEKRNIGYCLKGLAAIDMAQDRLPEARDKAEKSLALRSEMKDEAAAAASKEQLAEIALEQGRASEAESFARTACQVFVSQKALADGGQSCAVLARVLVVQGKIDEAHSAAARAVSLSQESGDVMARFDATLAVAAVQAQKGEFEQAAKALQTIRKESAALGFLGFELKTRLRLGELELQSGKRSAGNVSLQQLQRDAANSGFLLISRKAGADLNAPPLKTKDSLRSR
jgi:eukaryotic-like serine/threonine-protein kinase